MLVKDPIYRQLHDELCGLLRAGGFPPGAQFLTEREVGARFAVSRATANKALAGLVSEGMLEFRKGVGTFVAAAPLGYDLRALASFTGKCRDAGRTPSTKVLRFAKLRARSAPAEVRAALRAEAGEPLYFVERLRLADREPVILERRYIVASHCLGLSRADCAGSLYALWAERYRLQIAGAEQSIRAVDLSAHEARRLRVRPGRAGLLTIATGYLAGGAPLWWEWTLYRADAYEFQNRLGGLRDAHPAVGHFMPARGAAVPAPAGQGGA